MSTQFNGYRLRQARELRGLDQSELAQRVFLDVFAIRLMETGSKEPNADLLGQLCFVLGFPPSWFRQPYDGPELPLGSLVLHAARADQETK